MTVYTKHMQRRLHGGIAVNVCDRIHEACAYEVNCSRTLLKTGLSVTNSLVYGAVDRRSAHKSLMTKWSMNGVSLGVFTS